eukprot:comp18465_c1_seq1/m.19777 comp18465_c1_seq1/g.19777  ORF comp18465_c1_seq1/g.19777 comp18465_c1_seq1/m.19777 type:complete len:158 (-) comp18465_c1_seq1:461-934(-)
MSVSAFGQGEPVLVDVSGLVFETTQDTLCSFEDSMLAAWFSGRHALQRNEQGRVLIHLSRDPNLFFYILEFCKHKTVSALPTEGDVLERLAVEFDYFVLPFPFKRPNSLQNVFLRPLWRDMQGGAGRKLRTLAGDSHYAVAVAEQVLLVWDITTGHL